MEKLCVEDRSVSFARKFVLGFWGNLFNSFYFPLSWDFLIGNAPLTLCYFEFSESFHFSSYKLYNFVATYYFSKNTYFLSHNVN